MKLHAIQGAFEAAKAKLLPLLSEGPANFVFVPTSANSNVNEQPIGWEEIIKGANNRMANALAIANTEAVPRIAVVIENGMVELPANGANYFMDIGWVILRDLNTNAQYYSSSTSLSIPAELLEAVKEKGADKFTIGDVLHAQDASISPKDPHSALLGGLVSRVPLMEQAVLSCIGQWMYDLTSSKAKPT